MRRAVGARQLCAVLERVRVTKFCAPQTLAGCANVGEWGVTGARYPQQNVGALGWWQARRKADEYRQFPVRSMHSTHYARLGICPPSNAKEIKLAYLKQAKECHPDIHGAQKTSEFQGLSEAFSVLSNSKHKAAYDETLSASGQRQQVIILTSQLATQSAI